MEKSPEGDRERKREAVCDQLVESRCLLSCTTLMILCSHWYQMNVKLLAGNYVLKGIRKEWELDHATLNPRNVWMSCCGDTKAVFQFFLHLTMACSLRILFKGNVVLHKALS